MKIKYLFVSMLCIFALSSCIKDQVEETTKAYTDGEYETLTKALDLPRENHDYMLELPAHLGSTRVNSNSHQATLGRVLFYDKRLSANETVSCSSCHAAEAAFSDNIDFSEGFDGEHTKRNSLALGAFPSFNAYYGFGGTRMFWDERARTVAEQSDLTMRDPIEMGITDINEVGDRLLDEEYYRILFRKAYPTNNFSSSLSNKEKILQALDVFVSSIGSFNTRYDQGWAQRGRSDENFPNFTSLENEGKQLFDTHCQNCHNLGPGFSTSIINANNGLDMIYQDKGIGEISGSSYDNGHFKVPMLRNVALTAPYMHDGRFETLEEVVEHYNSSVANHPNLHNELKVAGGAKKLNLLQSQKESLVAFLHTLTDTESLAQAKYADPFK